MSENVSQSVLCHRFNPFNGLKKNNYILPTWDYFFTFPKNFYRKLLNLLLNVKKQLHVKVNFFLCHFNFF